MIDTLVHAVGSRFSPEQYLVLTRVEGMLWTVADILIVFYLLRVANVIRRYVDVRPHILSYGILFSTLPLVAVLPFAATGYAFFRLELLVTIPHFLIILYVCIGDAQHFARALYLRDAERAARQAARN